MCNCFSCENNKATSINLCENNKTILIIIIPKYNILNQSPPYTPSGEIKTPYTGSSIKGINSKKLIYTYTF